MKKKWFFIILLLIVVAVVLTIVFINLFTNKSTKALAENVNSVTQSGYLNRDNAENKQIDEFLDKLLKNCPEPGEDRKVVENYAQTFVAYETVGEFFNSEIVFATYTSAYKANRKSIQNNFLKAQSVANSLRSKLESLSVVASDSHMLLQIWLESKTDFDNLMKYTANAFEGLIKVYKASIVSKVQNNAFSDLIFDQFVNLQKDVLDAEENAGSKLSDFVNSYLTENNKVFLSYFSNAELKNRVEDIAENGEESEFYAGFVAGNILA